MAMSKGYTTVSIDTPVGKRLSKVSKPSGMFIVFQGKSVPIKRRISIGRGTDNTIELRDALVSRHHAAIQKVRDEYFIQDLQSTNGTFVNGQPVPPGRYLRLHQEDIVLIGRTRLSLQQLEAKVCRKPSKKHRTSAAPLLSPDWQYARAFSAAHAVSSLSPTSRGTTHRSVSRPIQRSMASCGLIVAAPTQKR